MKIYLGRMMVPLAMVWAVGCTTLGPPPSVRPNYVANPQLLGQDGSLQVNANAGYLSYQTLTAIDVPGHRSAGRVRGEACQNELRLPVELMGSHARTALFNARSLDAVWGNAAVAAAVRDALVGAPEHSVLYDLTLDLHETYVLGFFFKRQCLVASGSLGVPWVVAPVESAPAPTEEPESKAASVPEDEPELVPALPLGFQEHPEHEAKRVDRKKRRRPARHNGHHKVRAHRSH